MSLQLYNTRTRKIEPFQPLHGEPVGLYTCGPTVYSTAHLGNLRTYIFEDILKRTLEFNGHQVKHIMNITDVGHLTGDGDMGQDKVEEQAKAEQKSAYDIAALHTTEFFADLAKLNIQPPTKILKATDTIQMQIDLIKKLEANGFTYLTSDGVYYDTAKQPTYGQLSGQNVSDKKAGARVEVNSEKKHPTDFALWKFSKPEDHRQMEWPSPWGTGFPGWHIECSAMSISEFPNGLDIHCGGIDHIPVHHENEIAQNEGAGYHNFVNFWLHGEFLKLPGKRMGKSEGNAITLQQVIDKGIDPIAYRYLCLQSDYRKPLSFTWESLKAAATGLHRLRTTVATMHGRAQVGCAEFEQRFSQSIAEDLNTAQALAVMNEVLASNYPDSAKLQTLQVFDRVLGLDILKPASPSAPYSSTDEQTLLLEQYTRARREKRFADSDNIRQQFANMGLVVEDTPEGSRLRKM
jgi:cysteinyl-tRNA synthetase